MGGAGSAEQPTSHGEKLGVSGPTRSAVRPTALMGDGNGLVHGKERVEMGEDGIAHSRCASERGQEQTVRTTGAR